MFSREGEPYGDFDRGVLQALGLLVVNFAWLEDIVARATAWMIAREDSATTAHLLTRKVNFKTLIDLFGGVCRARFGEEYELYASEMCKALDTISMRRNELVHSLWDAREVTGGLTATNERLTRKGRDERAIVPTETEILGLATEIETLYFSFAEFILEHIYPANRPGLYDEPPPSRDDAE